jgi:hypothetical protein
MGMSSQLGAHFRVLNGLSRHLASLLKTEIDLL